MKFQCHKCGTINTINNIMDAVLKVDDEVGRPMCYKCCKDVKWYTEGWCDKCPDKVFCSGKALEQMIDDITKIGVKE